MNSLIETLNLWGGSVPDFAWPMLWQSSVLIAVLFVLDLAARRKIRASVRYALWLVVLVKLLGDIPLVGKLFRSESNAFREEAFGNSNSPAESAGKSGLAAGPAAPLNPEPLHTRVYRVDPNTFFKGLENISPLPITRTNVNAVVRDFFAMLGVELNPPKSIFFNDRAGDLLIRATSQDLDIIEAAVQVLNTAPVQVNIKVRFVELTVNASRALGLDWFPGNMLLTNSASKNTAENNMSQFTGILTDPQYRVVLRTLEERKDVNVLATQEVTTFSGRQAQVQTVELRTVVNGNNLPLPPLPRHAATNSGANSTYQTQVLPFGPVLDVIPYVSADGYSIQMTVIPTVTEFLGYDDPGKALSKPRTAPKDGGVLPLPRMRVRQMTASAIVWDGQTLVLGCSTDQSLAKKPDGSVERKDFAATKRKQLLVFVTPAIVDAGGNRVHREDELPFARETIPPQTPRK